MTGLLGPTPTPTPTTAMPTTSTGTQVYLTYNEMRLLRDAVLGYLYGEKESEHLSQQEATALDEKLAAAQGRVLDKRLAE